MFNRYLQEPRTASHTKEPARSTSVAQFHETVNIQVKKSVMCYNKEKKGLML